MSKRRYDGQYDWLITLKDGTTEVVRASEYKINATHLYFTDRDDNPVALYPLGIYQSVQKQRESDQPKQK